VPLSRKGAAGHGLLGSISERFFALLRMTAFETADLTVTAQMAMGEILRFAQNDSV
jgi:hypothetical protein